MVEPKKWPISFPSEPQKKIVQDIFAVYKISKSRLDQYLASPAAQRRQIYTAHLQAVCKELADDLYEAERDYYQLSLFGDIFEFSKKNDISFVNSLDAYVAGLIGVAMRMSFLVRAKTLDLKKGCINSNKDLLAQVRACVKTMRTDVYGYTMGDGTNLKIIDFIQSNASDGQTIYLLDCDIDEVFLELKRTAPSDVDRLLTERKLDLKLRRDFLAAEYSKNVECWREANKKNFSTAIAIGSDLSAELDGGYRSVTLSALFGLYLSDLRIKLSILEPINKQKDITELLNDPCYLVEMAADHLFWFSAFFIVMRDGGALIGGSYADGAAELLNALFTSPAKIGRVSCARTMEKLRSNFNRFFSLLLQEFSLEVRKVDWVDPAKMSSAAHLSTIADHMGSLCAKRLKGGLSAEQRRAMCRILSELIIPSYDSILDQLVVSVCDNQDITGSITVENWLDASDEEAADDTPEAEAEVSFIPETSNTERCWRYVHNPSNGISAYEKLVYSTESHVAAFFRKEQIKSSIGAGSIISAVSYFQGMDSCHKNLMIKEWTGKFWWYKVKRGGMRIFIQEDDDKHLYVHVFPRKEWKHKAA